MMKGVLVTGLAVASLVAGATGAGATNRSDDVSLAKQGLLVANDLPSGWSASKSSGMSDAAVIKLAGTVPGCGKYITLEKVTHATPQAHSLDWSDSSRELSNEVDVFSTEAKAGAALALYASPTVAPCLEGIFTKVLTQQFAKDPSTKGKVKNITVTLARQSVGALGDENVVYEGSATITLQDGSTQQIGLGNAALRLGRVVNDVTYTTTDASLQDVLQPAIDSSLARLQSAITTSS